MCWQVVLTTGEIHQSGAEAARDLESGAGAKTMEEVLSVHEDRRKYVGDVFRSTSKERNTYQIVKSSRHRRR
jgi:hypothetical protein